MEGESPLLKDGALSLQTFLSHRELPHKTPSLLGRCLVSLFVVMGVLWGSFWFGREVQVLYMVRLRTRLIGGM